MSDQKLPPLSDDVQELLRRERERPGLDRTRIEGMWSGISAELAVRPAASQGESNAPSGSAPASVVAQGLAPKLVGGALLKVGPWVALGLAFGGAGGFIVGHRAAQRIRPLGGPRDQPRGAGGGPVAARAGSFDGAA